ncbi:Trypsin [Phytophthora infestans]|uniref:Trypsin n=1 Tax=Phytophthora infestans TaxID=4787 RepID=A0A833SQ02_PHYIN|nr:Trypsin [Phytophthora infestans]
MTIKGGKVEKIRAIETFRHPLYNSTWSTYDVALLNFEKPSTHSSVRLGDAGGSDNKPGTMATVLGWGIMSGEDFAQLLQSADAEIIPDTECAKYAIDTDAMLCAGAKRGKGICGGDIGGPLVTNNGVVVGIASALFTSAD